jgi:uncharacterized protein with HEPN domain
MDPEVLTWLEQIRERIIELEEDVASVEFSAFLAARPLKRSAERNIEEIGEAMGRILRTMPDIAISEAKRIVSARNRLAHDYDRISHDILWLIIERDIPTLKEEVEALLRQHG